MTLCLCLPRSEEEHDGDRIRIRDWRPLEELGELQARARGATGLQADDEDGGGGGRTTEWTDNALLRAFISRFGVVRTTSAPPAPADDLEMTDFAAASVTPSAPPATVPAAVASSTGA